MITPPRISLARLPTPLVPMDRISAEIGGPRIWLKRDDLTETATSGNKIRKLEFTVAQALEENATTLITCGGIQSNHCRATAIIARQLGLEAHLILRGRQPEQADGNLLLDELAAAAITFVSRQQWDRLDEVFDDLESQYRSQGKRPFSIPVGASDEIGLWGYIEAAGELGSDFASLNIDPGYVVSAAGSGGTLGGLIVGRQRYELKSEMYAFNVSDDKAWFEQKIAADIDRWTDRYQATVDRNDLAVNVIDGYVGPGYGRADQPVFDTIKRVARTEGVILDPVYTGKAFDAMVREMGKGRFVDTSDIVFVHTGGIFGLFPQRGEL